MAIARFSLLLVASLVDARRGQAASPSVPNSDG